MARDTTEPWGQLATRIPRSLHREVKLHCARVDTSIMVFVVAALKEKLPRQGPNRRRTRAEDAADLRSEASPDFCGRCQTISWRASIKLVLIAWDRSRPCRR